MLTQQSRSTFPTTPWMLISITITFHLRSVRISWYVPSLWYIRDDQQVRRYFSWRSMSRNRQFLLVPDQCLTQYFILFLTDNYLPYERRNIPGRKMFYMHPSRTLHLSRRTHAIFMSERMQWAGQISFGQTSEVLASPSIIFPVYL